MTPELWTAIGIGIPVLLALLGLAVQQGKLNQKVTDLRYQLTRLADKVDRFTERAWGGADD